MHRALNLAPERAVPHIGTIDVLNHCDAGAMTGADMARVLPETSGRLAKLKTGAETLMALPAEAF